jgi:hypothetical protein
LSAIGAGRLLWQGSWAAGSWGGCGSGSWGGRCPSLGAYVSGRKATAGLTPPERANVPYAHGKHPNGWMPEQKITLDEVIRAFTVGSAYAGFQDGVKGSIAPGKLADLVLLDRDIYSIDPPGLDQVRVVMTVVDGRVVYEKATR